MALDNLDRAALGKRLPGLHPAGIAVADAPKVATKRTRKPIDCAISVVQCLASAKGPLGVTEIAKLSGLTKSNVCRTLTSLENVRWVSQDVETAKYSVGPKILQIGLMVVSNLDVRIISLPYMNRLRDLTGETAVLSLCVGLEQMPIDQVQSNHELRSVIQLGKVRPLWSSATGKAILAWLTERETNAVFADLAQSGVRVLASGQMVDSERLMEDLQDIRRTGFAISVGERLVGVAAVAAPILNHSRHPVAAIAVMGPIPRFTTERARDVGPELVQIAKNITAGLGGGD